MSKNNFRMQRDIFSGDIQVQFLSRTESALYVAEPPILKQINAGEYAPPFLKISTTEAQQMIDELWNCGLRPSEGTGSAGALAATERHLADMKAIAFKALKIDV